MGGMTSSSPAAIESCLDTRTNALRSPKNLAEASLWVQIAIEKMGEHDGLISEERRATFLVVREAIRTDPHNAFWSQILAVLLVDSGQSQRSKQAWLSSAKRTSWQDYQTDRLLAARRRISALTGVGQAWQLAYLYSQRRDTVGAAIERYARGILTHADLDSSESLDIRYATILNGQLLRDGSHSLKAAQYGSNIIELAAYPADMTRTNNPKRLLLGQNRVINSLRALNRTDEATMAQTTFRNNEAWKVLTQRENPEDAARLATILSLASSSAASSFLLASIAGAILWGAGRLLEKFAGSWPMFNPILTTVLGFALGTAVYELTHTPWAAAATALSITFLTTGPRTTRSSASGDLGPLFTFVILTIGSFFALSLVMFSVGQMAAGKVLAPILGFPSEFFGRGSLFAGLSVIILGLVFILAPLYGLVQKRPTPQVLCITLRRMGAIIGIGGLLLTFVLVPAMAMLDRSLDTTLMHLVENEPMHYLLR